jgi:hypothetical protein
MLAGGTVNPRAIRGVKAIKGSQGPGKGPLLIDIREFYYFFDLDFTPTTFFFVLAMMRRTKPLES